VAPGLWLNEGGQSVTGALLDHMLAWHAQGQPGPEGHARVIARIGELHAEAAGPSRLHVLPDFHGNRSPLADPQALGVISGLSLDASFDSLARLYDRTALAIVLGTRHILDALNAEGYAIDHLHITGGHTHNPLLMELYANATGCTVLTAAEADAVLLGTGMVAATAAGLYPDLAGAAAAMAREGEVIAPDLAKAERYARDYRVFLAMHEQRRALDAIR
jgi:ribulose kinase